MDANDTRDAEARRNDVEVENDAARRAAFVPRKGLVGLENAGYTIVAQKPARVAGTEDTLSADRQVVLAFNEVKDEWVTWITDNQGDGYYWGHYVRDAHCAVRDFQLR